MRRLGRPRLVRATTIGLANVSRTEREEARLILLTTPEPERPRARADCTTGGRFAARPCPFAGCRYHLYIDVSAAGSIKLNFPDLDIDSLAETCALDVADGGGRTLEEVGMLTNVTRERVRQIEASAERKLRLPMLQYHDGRVPDDAAT